MADVFKELCILLKGTMLRPQARTRQYKLVISGSKDCTIRFWDIEASQYQPIIETHGRRIWDVVFLPRGNQLATESDLIATGSDDKKARLWDAESGECRAVIPDLQGAVRGISWATTLDGRYIVIGCQDGSVSKWQVIKEDDQYRVSLKWSVVNDSLNVTGVSIEGVRFLTAANKQLLKGRGAVGEPSRY
ncbi:MAG: WD40-repeat-containing domain protein [Benniella sp.]|nr:MAG: WD40-repeat-containing domain protein [Benniella sp.]